MRTNLLNDLSNVVRKGAGLACSWSQVGRMSEEGAIEHPLSTHSAPFGTTRRPAGDKATTPFGIQRLAAVYGGKSKTRRDDHAGLHSYERLNACKPASIHPTSVCMAHGLENRTTALQKCGCATLTKNVKNSYAAKSFLRLAAMVILLLTLACGQMWAYTQAISVSEPTTNSYGPTNGVSISGTTANNKTFNGVSSSKVFKVSSNSGTSNTITISSTSANIKQIYFDVCAATSGTSATPSFTVTTSSDNSTYTAITSGITVSGGATGTTTTSGENIYVSAYGGHSEVTITFTTAQQYVRIVKGNASNVKETDYKTVTVYTDASSRTFKSGQKVFFKDYSGNITWGNLNCLWKVSSGNIYAYFWNDTESAWTTAATAVGGDVNAANTVYSLTVPGSGKEYTKVLFTRGTAATFESGFWNETTDQYPAEGKNMFCISNDGDYDGSRNPTHKWIGTWSTYANGPAVVGDMNKWIPDGGEFNFTGSTGTMYMDLAASTDYKFKVLEGTTWYGNTGTITNTITSWWGFVNGGGNCTLTTGEAGSYAFKWDNSTKYLGVYYPQARLKQGEYIYFDARNNSTWKDGGDDARFWFKYYDSDSNYPNDQTDYTCTKANALDTWVYPYVVPANDYLGQVQVDRRKSGTWQANTDKIQAHTRTSSKQNCILLNSSNNTTSWTTYCPPMSSATLSDNSTAMISWQTGDGTSANPYLVSASGTIKVIASATKAVNDANMTPMYDFKVNTGSGASSAQSSTSNTFDKGSLSNNTTYEISLDAWNNYNSTDGTKNTSATHLWYKAVTLRDVTHTLTNVTCTGGRAQGTGQAADNEPYTATFTASTGYNLPATITVKFGNTTKTAGTDYTWNSSTGVVSIPASKINGNVTIIVAGVAKTTSITLDDNDEHHGASGDGSATATFNETSLTSVSHTSPTAGYQLNGYYTAKTAGTKIINADGSFVTASTDYTTSDGKWKSVLGELTLYAQYVDKSYGVTHTLTNVTKTSGGTTATHGTNYTAEFAAGDGYDLPDAITVTIGGEDATEDTEYTWTPATGTVVIDGDYITGAIVITVTGESVATYSVTYNKNNGSATGSVPTDATAYTSSDSVVVKVPGDLALSNYTFVGWNTKSDGSGTYASPGARIKMSGDLTLYAVWQSASSCPGSSGGTVFALTMKTNTNTTKNIGIGESVLLGTTYATTLTGGNVSFTDVGTRTSGRGDTKASLQKGGSGNKDKIYFGGNDAMMTIYLDCALEEGDVITYTGGDTQLSFTTTPVYGNSVYTSSKSYTIPNASALIGKKIIYCWRKTTTSFSVTDISITRPASCSAPAAPTISGTTTWTVGDDIELTATCASGADASTTYTWYKGASWATAYAAGAVQAAATGSSGCTLTIDDCTADDKGTYWCEASNGSGCEAHNTTGYTIDVPLGDDHVLIWNMTFTDGASSLYNTHSESSTSSYLASQTALAVTGITLSSDGKSDATPKLANSSSEDNSKCAYVTFAVESGYQFIPDSVILSTTAVTDAKTIVVELGSNKQTWSQTASGSSTPTKHNYTFSSPKACTGTVTLKIHAYNSTKSSKFRIGTPIKIYGTVSAVTGYTVTYADGGATSGSVPEDASSPYDEGATVTVLGNTGSLARNGYEFNGWSDGVNTYSAGNTFTMPDENVTLTAQWTANTYTITYHLNGASWAGAYSAPATYTVGTGATLPVAGNMTNTGYTFNGWKNNSGLTGDNITAISTSDYGNKEFWAKWTENTYTITYKANGDGAGNDGDVTGSTSSTNGHYVTVADNGFALEDHVFAGWNTAANGSGESYSEGEEIELTDDMTLYAIWADDYNVTWGDVQIGGAGDAVTPNLGGGNYTITATISSWDGDTEDIELGDVTEGVIASITGTTATTVTITFAVGTDVVGEEIELSINIPAHGDYGAKVATTDAIEIEICSGGTIVWDFTTADFKNGGTWSTSGGAENKAYATDEETILRYYAGGSSDEWDSSNKQLKTQGTTSFSTGTSKKQMTQKYFQFPTLSGSATISVTYGTTGDDLKIYEATSTNIYGIDPIITLTTSSTTSSSYPFSSAKTYYMTMESKKSYFKNITVTYAGGGSSVTPTLTWSPLVSSDADWDGVNSRLNKRTSDADFTFTATQDKNSLGAITYASSNTSVVTVNATTGKVHVEGAGDATITATLAESGCYNKATATYAIHVVDDCDDEAGTISTEDLGCDGIRMTVTGHTAAEGVSYQWYKVGSPDTEVSGATSASYTATAAGEYYVIVTNTGDRHCAKTSTNTVVVAAKAAVTASKIVDSWYVKNGRRTPDIALVQTTNTTDFTVAFKGSTTIWDPTNSVSTGFGGCPFRLGTDGIIYLDGQSSLRAVPTGMTVGDTTITITAKGCGAGNNQSVDIKLHVQAATDHPSVAYVSLGTAAGAVTDTTAGYYKTAALYKYLDNTLGGGDFDLTAQNAYWSVDEKELKQHYSQFDAILITDDPSTDKSKKVDGKDYSYINAIGCLIDVRPILTMEAYVAKRDNWKAKGITGTPESPNPRQYGMKLQCKQHAIFSGVNPASSNVEVETIDGVDYWTVLMVDSTMSPYTGIDWNEQTAGDQKPALQGFAASSVSEDLLLLGEIKDGALYAGVERQTEPAARLLVLGINAKALPSALTAEGKLILENSLHYLLETDLEKVDDCSNYFTGATDSDWNKSTNWSKGQVPNSPTIRVRILKPCVVSSGTPIKAASVDIATSGKSYHLSGGTCSGKLTINAGGALIVGGEVRSAVAPNFNSVNLKPTTEDDLILNTSGSAQSALILNNDDGDTKATVNLYSLGRFKDAAYQFQYFAVPMTYLDVNPAFAGAGIYTYVWTEADGWERRAYYKGIEAFEGVGITTTFTTARTYQMKGTLASTEEREITLTTGGVGDGQNIIGNSWLAPIDIASLRTGLLEEDVQKTVYIYCTGKDGASVTYGTSETPGQWLAIPIDAVKWPGWGGLKVIPAMQGFCIIANSETTLTLNYDELVRKRAATMNRDTLTTPLRAPKREAEAEDIELIRIRVADSQTHTDLYLFEGESFSEEFDNGWEAKYMSGDGRSAKLYAETAIGPMAVVAQPEYEGTVLGFAPGKETEYTFTFSGPSKEYYLNDLKEKKSTLISEDESYMFTFEEGDTNRFYISKTPINAPSVATGTENTGDGAKARKVIYNNHVYIIRAGKVYGIDGTLVVPNMEQK